MADEKQLWQQQTGEPNHWYTRLHRFLLAGPSRSLLGVFNAEQVEKGRKKSSDVPGSWRNAAEKWFWRDRASAWDAYQCERNEQLWQQRRDVQRQREWDLAENLLKRAGEMLLMPLEDAKWGLRDAATFIELSSKLARQSAEMYQGDLNAAISYVRKFGYSVIDEQAKINDEPEE